jgi:hypothetical protein
MCIIPQPDLFSQGPDILNLFYNYLPPRPYCTDFLGGLNIRPKNIAAKNAYIQPNPITRVYWLVFDIDSAESRYWPDEWHIPTPNIEVRNPDNNHQHLFYMIDPAIYTLQQARRKPLELAAEVDRGMTRLLEADPGYGKLIAKNPLSKKWTVYVWHQRAWGLIELLEFIPDKIRRWKTPPRDVSGLGRNCALFDKARFFAYAEWQRLKYDDAGRLYQAVYGHAMNINLSFNTPMSDKEVRCITKSITKWTSRHISREGRNAWGERNRDRSLKIRQKKAAIRAGEVRAYKRDNPQSTVREMAIIFDCAIGSVSKYLNAAP